MIFDILKPFSEFNFFDSKKFVAFCVDKSILPTSENGTGEL